CVFCASSIGGFKRDLSAAEMVGQIYAAAKDTEKRISHVVIMGMGEPLDNYDNILRFIEIITHPKGANISPRRITLSTCGIIPKIKDLAARDLQITLAISLHAPNDQIRRQIMPISKIYPMDKLLDTAKMYAQNQRRITFEYALISGINDSPMQANELARRLKGIFCHVNLIGVNSVDNITQGERYAKSGKKTIAEFARILTQNGINVTIRRELGPDIAAACGQLRNQNQK
ncbi:MAG: radical SAM protein, partial [Defluviitaleaceae bacterium]|nr:radical SAM protein [Defluviitaleaceae bacterium]